MVKKMQDEKTVEVKLSIGLSIGEFLFLAFGWLFIVFEFVFATYNLYLLMSGHSNNAITHCVNALGGFLVVFYFHKIKDKVFLSKGYLLLTLFAIMCCAVIFVLSGTLKRAATVEDLTAFLIMVIGTALIVYLSHRFFNRGDDTPLWQVEEKPDYTQIAKMSDETLIREFKAVDKQFRLLEDFQMNAAENGTYNALNLHITEIIFVLVDKHGALRREIQSRGLKC